MKYSIDVVIVNYNGEKVISKCIKSIKRYLKNYKLYIVDNNSQDNSIEVIEGISESNTNLYKNENNIGFGKGNNIGVSYGNARYILLLNNDSFLYSSIDNAIDLLEKKEDIGIVSGTMIGKKDEIQLSFGNFPGVINSLLLKKLYISQNEYEDNEKNIQVDWVEGSFMLLRRYLFEKVSGFSNDFHMYFEDVDLCKRFSNIGYKTVVISKIIYKHIGGYNKAREKQLLKSLLIYHKKHSPWYVYYLVLVLIKVKGFLKTVIVLIKR